MSVRGKPTDSFYLESDNKIINPRDMQPNWSYNQQNYSNGEHINQMQNIPVVRNQYSNKMDYWNDECKDF